MNFQMGGGGGQLGGALGGGLKQPGQGGQGGMAQPKQPANRFKLEMETPHGQPFPSFPGLDQLHQSLPLGGMNTKPNPGMVGGRQGNAGGGGNIMQMIMQLLQGRRQGQMPGRGQAGGWSAAGGARPGAQGFQGNSMQMLLPFILRALMGQGSR